MRPTDCSVNDQWRTEIAKVIKIYLQSSTGSCHRELGTRFAVHENEFPNWVAAIKTQLTPVLTLCICSAVGPAAWAACFSSVPTVDAVELKFIKFSLDQIMFFYLPIRVLRVGFTSDHWESHNNTPFERNAWFMCMTFHGLFISPWNNILLLSQSQADSFAAGTYKQLPGALAIKRL